MTINRPTDYLNGPNCGVTAVAVLANVSLNDAFRVVGIAKYGRAPSRRWKGGTRHPEREAALAHFGLRCIQVRLPARMQLATWVRRHSVPGVTYMVRTTRHVQVVLDGNVTDQCHDATPVEAFRQHRKIVTGVWEVTR